MLGVGYDEDSRWSGKKMGGSSPYLYDLRLHPFGTSNQAWHLSRVIHDADSWLSVAYRS